MPGDHHCYTPPGLYIAVCGADIDVLGTVVSSYMAELKWNCTLDGKTSSRLYFHPLVIAVHVSLTNNGAV